MFKSVNELTIKDGMIYYDNCRLITLEALQDFMLITGLDPLGALQQMYKSSLTYQRDNKITSILNGVKRVEDEL